MIKGFRFTNQLANAQVDARIHQELLNKNDGIFYGMNLSRTNNSVTVSDGLCEIAGRPVAVMDSETVAVSSESLYCLLVLEIDLSKESTRDTFMQAYFKLVTSSNAYPSVTQQDINKLNTSDNIYQLEFARFRSGTNGITDFEDRRKFLSYNDIYTQIKNDNEKLVKQIQEEIENVKDGSIYQLKGNVLYENRNGEDNVTLNDNISDYNRLEIFYGFVDSKNKIQKSTVYDVNEGGKINMLWSTQDPGTIILRASSWEINNNYMYRVSETAWNKWDNSISSSTDTKIFKVVGYR